MSITSLKLKKPRALAINREEEARPPEVSNPSSILQSGTPPTISDNRQRMTSETKGITATDRWRYAQELNEVLSNLDPLDTEAVSISLMSYEQMVKLKVCDISVTGWKENSRYESVNDPRMGTIGNSNDCSQCYQLNCAGHYGMITFGDKNTDTWWEIYNPLFVREIVRVLNSVCHTCSGVLDLEANLREEGILKVKGLNRLKLLEEHSKKVTCSRSLPPTTVYLTVIGDSYRFLITSPDGKTQIIQGLPSTSTGSGPKKATDKAALGLLALERLANGIQGDLAVFTDLKSLVSWMNGSSFSTTYKKEIANLREKKNLKVKEIPSNHESLLRLQKTPAKEIVVTEGVGIGTCGPLVGCSQKREYITSRNMDVNTIMFKTKGAPPAPMPFHEVFQILDCIKPEDAKLLGFGPDSHPRDFILRGLLVLPLPTRPPRKQGGTLSPHPLTVEYEKIVNVNERIRENRAKYAQVKRELDSISYIDNTLIERKSKLEGEFESLHAELSSKVKALFSGGEPKSTYPEELISILSILSGKKGTMRSAMLGKRGDYCGRTVITPDPSIKVGEIGLPMAARIQTVSETVNSINFKYAEELMLRGEVTAVKTKSKPYNVNPRVITEADWSTYRLQIGDTIFRKLRDGDIVIVNRQPTLRKHSMMAFRVRLVPGYTIRLHPTMVGPFNADFDGDEMNFWLPQSAAAIAEAMVIMDAVACSMSSESTGPVVGLIQDLITAAFIMTFENQIYDEITFQEVISQISEMQDLGDFYRRLERYNVNPTSGRAMFSALLPPDFYYENGPVLIVDGILVRGALTSRDVGAVPRSIIHHMIYQYGEEKIRKYLTDATYMLSYYITDVRGFTLSWEDCKSNPEIERLKDELFNDLRVKVEMLQSELVDPITGEPNPLQEEYVEEQVKGLVLAASGKLASFTKEQLADGNNFGVMSKETGGGGKGAPFNISHNILALGQQFYKDERVRKILSGGTRCSPYFSADDNSIEHRGFCVRSFAEGMDPASAAFHAASMRNDIFGISTKTPDTGHIMRQLVKFLEDLRVVYDGTVRNSSGVVFQFVYGDGGLDSSKCIQVNSPYSKDLATFADPITTAAKLNITQGWVPIKALGEELPPGKVAGRLRKEDIRGQKYIEPWRYEQWARLRLEDKGEPSIRDEWSTILEELQGGKTIGSESEFTLKFLSQQGQRDSPYYDLLNLWVRKGILPQVNLARVLTLLERRGKGRPLSGEELQDLVDIIGQWEPKKKELLELWNQGGIIPLSDSERVSNILSQEEPLTDEDKIFVANTLLHWGSEDPLVLEKWLEGGPDPSSLPLWRQKTSPSQLAAQELETLLDTWGKGKAVPELQAEYVGRFLRYWFNKQPTQVPRAQTLKALSERDDKLRATMEESLSTWATRHDIPQTKAQEFIAYWNKAQIGTQAVIRPKEVNGNLYPSPLERWIRSNLQAWAKERTGDAVSAQRLLGVISSELTDTWRADIEAFAQSWIKERPKVEPQTKG